MLYLPQPVTESLGAATIHFSQASHRMPNRGELAIPARSADFGAQDAWMVIGFCAIGWLMTISVAASLLGSGTLPKFPWG
jgi:hypothetical protein